MDEAFLVRAMGSKPDDVIGNKGGRMFSGHEIMHMCPLYGRYDRIVTTEMRLFTVSLSVVY